MRRTKLF